MPTWATISAALQIAILYFAIYAILKRAKGSRFGQALLVGLGTLILLYVCFSYLFSVLALILQYLLMYFAIAAVVIFQPEIRRFIASFGTFAAFNPSKTRRADGSPTPAQMLAILSRLAEKRIGALFAFERGISLRSYEETGVRTDAVISRELVFSVFTPPLPLHDGGAVVRDGRLSSAHCIFPVSKNPDLTGMGMRHCSAVGLSEETDAIVFIVSEERGEISVAHGGRLVRCGTGNAVAKRWLERALGGHRKENRLKKKAMDAVQRLFFRQANTAEGKEKGR